jgi:hypothetical protein
MMVGRAAVYLWSVFVVFSVVDFSALALDSNNGMFRSFVVFSDAICRICQGILYLKGQICTTESYSCKEYLERVRKRACSF